MPSFSNIAIPGFLFSNDTFGGLHGFQCFCSVSSLRALPNTPILVQFVDLYGCKFLVYQCMHPSHVYNSLSVHTSIIRVHQSVSAYMCVYIFPQIAQSSGWSRHDLWTLDRGSRENSFVPSFSLQRGQAIGFFLVGWYTQSMHESVLQIDKFLFLFFLFNAFAIQSYILCPP